MDDPTSHRPVASPAAPTRGPRTILALACAVLIGASPGAAPAAAQALDQRVAQSPDGWVRFAYEVREGVCGRRGGVYVTGSWEGCDCACEDGPMWVDLQTAGGEVRGIETSVGAEPEPRIGTITDLGRVEPAVASDFLLDLAEWLPGNVGEDAVFPAVVARDVVTWPRLLEMARRDRVAPEVRSSAVFWVGQAAGEKAVEGLESVIRDPGELEVRKHAVFALSRHESDLAVDVLIDVARRNPEPELRKTALFWLGRRADEDPRVLALFEEILGGG